MKYELIFIDWKQFSDDTELNFKRCLKNLNVHMYRLPMCAGSDTYGFILCNEKLTRQKIKDISKAHQPC